MTDTIAHSLPGGPLLTRREAIAGAAAAITLPASVAHAATDRARGVVFEDTDGSGRRTSNSRGVPGVMVSNGREVVVTDASGSWSLPVAAASRSS